MSVKSKWMTSRGAMRLILLPLEKVADERLKASINAAELREAVDEDGKKTSVGEQIVDKRKDVVGEVDGQLPRILQSERLLVAQRVVADGVGRDVSLVDRFHHLLVEAALVGQLGVVFGLDRVGDESVVERDQIAAGAVERVGEAAGFAGDGPARRADCLLAVVCEVFERGVVKHTPIGQVAREKWKLFAHPVDQLLDRIDAFARNQPVVVDKAETGLAVERDGPEPEPFGAEVVRGLPGRSVAERGAIGLVRICCGERFVSFSMSTSPSTQKKCAPWRILPSRASPNCRARNLPRPDVSTTQRSLPATLVLPL